MMTIRAASLGAALVVATLAAVSLVGPASAQDPAERRGALVDQIVITQEPDVGKVAGLIETGSHHVFAQGVGNGVPPAAPNAPRSTSPMARRSS